MNKINVGWSEVSITPDKKISLAGQFAERISEYVETPITVTALAIEDGEEQLIICSCDLISIGENLVAGVRELVKRMSDEIDTDKIIISAIHTHTSHTYSRDSAKSDSRNAKFRTMLDAFVPPEKQYKPKVSAKGDDFMNADESLEYLTERIARAAVGAWDNRRSARYAQGFGRAAVGMCRRACYTDGSAKMWGDTNLASFTELEGGNDSGIEMLFFYDENEKLTGIAANVACPAQVLEHRLFISSDYWGKVKQILREKYGDELFVLGLCSAAGDQCPRDLIRWVNPETPIDDPNIERNDYIERDADPSMFDIKGSRVVGRRIANEIIMALEDVEKTFDKAVLKHEKLTVDLSFRHVTPKEYEEAVEMIKKYAAGVEGHINFNDTAKMYVHMGTVMRWEEQHKQSIYPVEVHIARLGNVAIATNPFELFLDYGNRIRARSRARQTFLIQLACGAGGYLPTKKAEKGSHYSAYVSSGNVGHEGGEQLVRKTVEEINKMFSE
ncbi:MAG: hypothetical protein IJH37_13175 [Clostridia bacterium]|nr:hypothetical protein [Clostridia bacterium]